MQLTIAQAASLKYLNALGIDVWLPKQYQPIKAALKATQTHDKPSIQRPKIPKLNKPTPAPAPTQKAGTAKSKPSETSSVTLNLVLNQLSNNLNLLADLNGLSNHTQGFNLVTNMGQAIKKELEISTPNRMHSLKWPNQVLGHTPMSESYIQDTLIGFLDGKQCFAHPKHWILLGPTLGKLLQTQFNLKDETLISEHAPVFKITQNQNKLFLHACPIQQLTSDKQAKTTLWHGLKALVKQIKIR